MNIILTDIVKIGRTMGLNAGVGLCDEADTIGVNSQAELSHAELIFQTNKRIEMMEMGIAMQAPQTADTEIASD